MSCNCTARSRMRTSQSWPDRTAAALHRGLRGASPRAFSLLSVGAIVVTASFAWAADASITILTSRMNSPHYPMAVALARVLSKMSTPVKATAQSTKDAVETLGPLDEGRADLALASGDSLSAAWQGSENAGFFKPLKNLRGVASLYPNYIQFVARADSGVRTLRDLKGKRVSVGVPRSSIEQDARAILAAAGVSYRDLGRLEYLPFGESVELIKDGKLDATLQSATIGVSTLRDLAASLDLVFVPVPVDILRKVNDPAYLKATIPANTYRGQRSDVPTAAVVNVLVTREDMNDDVVYQMTKALWSDIDQLIGAHPAAHDTERTRALLGMVVPVHPGAERYYREAGILK